MGDESECATYEWLETVESMGGVAVETFLLLYCFMTLAFVADDYFVPSLERITERLEIPNHVAGCTFMAIGTAAPEIFVSLLSSIKAANTGGKTADLGVGAVIGSGIFCYLVIPGVCSIFASQGLSVSPRLLLRDVTCYILVVALLIIFARDNMIEQWEAWILFCFYVLYLLLIFNWNRLYSLLSGSVEIATSTPLPSAPTTLAAVEDPWQHLPWQSDFVAPHVSLWEMLGDEEETEAVVELSNMEIQIADASDSTIQYGVAAAPQQPSNSSCIKAIKSLARPLRFVLSWTLPNCSEESPHKHLYPVTFGLCITYIALLSGIIVSIIDRLVCHFHVPHAIFGLTVVAIGAEVPDMFTSIAVAKKGYGDMAVCSAISSQITNIVVGLGVPWIVYTLMTGHALDLGTANLRLASIVLFAFVVLFVCIMASAAWYVGKPQGVVLLCTYVLFTLYVALADQYGWYQL